MVSHGNHQPIISYIAPLCDQSLSPFSLHWYFSVWEVFFCVGAHGWVALLCRPWWPYFNLGGGCQTWKPLETPGTQPPFSNAVVNGVEIKATQSTCKTFYPEAVVLFKYWLISPVNYFLLLLVDHLLCHHEDDTKALLIIVKVFNNLRCLGLVE